MTPPVDDDPEAPGDALLDQVPGGIPVSSSPALSLLHDDSRRSQQPGLKGSVILTPAFSVVLDDHLAQGQRDKERIPRNGDTGRGV